MDSRIPSTPIETLVSDDSGPLGLLDCAAYSAFVDADWQYEQLLSHFREQARRRCIVVWDANDGGGNYRVQLRHGICALQGHRSFVGAIRVTAGALHLASYTALTMAAQYADEPLPARQETGWRLPLVNGDYRVRVVQMFDPDLAQALSAETPHFVIEVPAGVADASQNVAWHAQLTRQWGEKSGVATFTSRKVACTENDAWGMAAVTSRLANANGVYRGPAGSALVFLTFDEIKLEVADA